MFDIKSQVLPNGEGEILVYGDIVSSSWDRGQEEDITPKMFNDALNELGNVKKINVRINSYGGNVFAGRAMGVMLEQKKKEGCVIKTIAEGVAASMASVLFEYGDIREMWSGTLLMIHKPALGVYGNADDLEKARKLLDQVEDTLVEVYMRHFNGTEEELRIMLAEETWIEAERAYSLGLCSIVEGVTQISAHAVGYDIGGLVVPRSCFGSYAKKIDTSLNKGGETSMYDKETDAKIKNFLEQGLSVTVTALDNGKYTVLGSEVAEGMLLTAPDAFISEEQAQRYGLEKSNPEQILSTAQAVQSMNIPLDKSFNGLSDLLANANAYKGVIAKVKEDALKLGVCAKGDKFDSERWGKILDGMTYAEIESQAKEWEEEAQTALKANAGRLGKNGGGTGIASPTNVSDYKF